MVKTIIPFALIAAISASFVVAEVPEVLRLVLLSCLMAITH